MGSSPTVKRKFRLLPWLVIYPLLIGPAKQAGASSAEPRATPPPIPAQVPVGGQTSLPGYSAVVEKRPLGTSAIPYALVKTTKRQTAPTNGYTLVIFFGEVSGTGDPVPGAMGWLGIVNNRPDVIVAVPGFNQAPMNASMVSEIIDDTVAHDHVNPRQVFAVGYIEGVPIVDSLMQARPELFAGLAYLGGRYWSMMTFPDPKHVAADLGQYAPKMGLYLADGTKSVNNEQFADLLTHFKSLGFTKIAVDRPDCDAHIPGPLYVELTMKMLAFFDRVMLAKAPKEKEAAATQSRLAKSLVTANRALAKPHGSYVFLTPDRKKFPAQRGSTLLICLHGSGDTAVNFAKSWADLVKSRTDVVVAIPEATGNNASQPWGADTADLVQAVIADTVARDHVNPQHVILAGYEAGCVAGGQVVGEHPELFAGFANLATDFPAAFFTPAVQEHSANLAVYYAYATKDQAITIPPALKKQLEAWGYTLPLMQDHFQTNLQVEKFAIAGHITPDQFKFQVTRLMEFFDRTMAENDQAETMVTRAQK
jgi:poly(3-hydroxybutyrate) depolymerase